jgi:hypothetical protein
MISHDQFRKSSFSGGGGCVEVRCLPNGRIAVRDSKDLGLPPNDFSPNAWKAFLAGIRTGEFDLR